MCQQPLNTPIVLAKKEVYLFSVSPEDKTLYPEIAGMAGWVRLLDVLCDPSLNHCFLRKISPVASWADLAFGCVGYSKVRLVGFG